MATPFVSIDLSSKAIDFENTVIEAGWPLLDDRNTNYQILRSWFGSAVAEPERKGGRVGFYIRNDAGGRVDDPKCIPVNERELTGPLQKQFDALVKKVQSVEPKTSTERKIHRLISEELTALNTDARVRDRRCYLFKYQVSKKQWQLIWCPGFRRKDNEPANPEVCTNPSCLQLFVVRGNGRRRCPGCQSTEPPPPPPPPWPFARILLALLLLVLLGGCLAWYFRPPPPDLSVTLIVNPAKTTVPVGSRLEFVVKLVYPGGEEEDVSSQAMTTAEDPKIASSGPLGAVAMAKSPGMTVLNFHVGEYSTTSELVVEPPENPTRLLIEPAQVTLGPGTTTQLKLFGEYEDGRKIDLTSAPESEWISQLDDLCFIYLGQVEGQEIGTYKVRAKYRASPGKKYLEATATINVVQKEYKSLSIGVDPESIVLGQAANLSVSVDAEGDEQYSVIGSELLLLTVEPPNAASVQGSMLRGLKLGKVTLSATFRGLTSKVDLRVVESKDDRLRVKPDSLNLSIGEIADLDVIAPSSAPIQLTSSDSEVAEVTDTNRLVGRSEGTCEIVVSQGDKKATVKVTVSPTAFQSIAIIPEKISVKVDDSVPLRVVGIVDNSAQIEIAPNELEWISFPRPETARLDKGQPSITGVNATGGSSEPLKVRYRNHEASAEVQVLSSPLKLELTPSGPIELPVGQKTRLKLWASYGNGRRVEIDNERIEWNSDTVDGMSFESGEVSAEKPDVGPITVFATYQNQKSNEVQITSVRQLSVTLVLRPEPSTLAVDETGYLIVAAASLSGQPISLDYSGISYQSSDTSRLEINKQTGAFRAMAAGKVTVSAVHPAANNPATAEVTITEKELGDVRPTSVTIVSDQQQPIDIPLGARFGAFRIEAEFADGKTRDVTRAAVLIIEGDPQVAAVNVRDGHVIGIRPGEGLIRAEYGGVSSNNGLPFRVSSELDIDTINVSPSRVTLNIGESTKLEAVGFMGGRRIGLISGLAGVEWISQDPKVANVAGSLVTGMSAGHTTIAAKFGDISSPAVEVTVLEPRTPISDKLVVDPGRLRIRAGASVRIGTDVTVHRGGADFSQSAIVAPASTGIVSYDAESNTLTGITPGSTRVSFTLGNQIAAIDVQVVSAAQIGSESRVVIEPSNGELAVGERIDLSAYLIAANGQREGMTSSIVLESSDPEVARVDGNSLQALSAGEVRITGKLPGVEKPAIAVFNIEDVEFSSLVINPLVFRLSVGQRRDYRISAISKKGTHHLGDHPELKVSAGGEDPNCISVSPHSREILGVSQGQATLIANWRGLNETAAVRVGADPITALVLRPTDAVISTGEKVDYQVFARRGQQLQPLTLDDGIELEVDDPSTAAKESGLRVEGIHPGSTRVTALYGSHRVDTPLQVTPVTKPVAPPARAIGLRFIPSTFRLELGTPGDSIRVMRVYSDGTEEDVDHLATLTIRDPQDVIEIKRSSSGPVVVPKKIGQTQVDAQLDDLKTRAPLLVDVSPKIAGRARLVVTPNPLRIPLGATRAFSRAVVYPRQGKSPFEVPFKVKVTETPLMDLLSDGSIRANDDTPGSAVAEVIVDAESDYGVPSTSVTVQVGDTPSPTTPDSQKEQRFQTRLELTGPSQATVGEEVAFRVMLVDENGLSRPVTNDSTMLEVARSDKNLVEALPGCRLNTLKPGNIVLHARHGKLLSNAHHLKVHPLAKKFARLELMIDNAPMAVGESRSYRLWGYPEKGGPRQDLTHLVTDDQSATVLPHILFQTVKPNPGTQVAIHKSPSIVAKQPGSFSLQAAIANDVQSNRVEIPVVGGLNAATKLIVEPSSISTGVGETTQKLKVLVRSPGDKTFREIDIQGAGLKLQSRDEGILKPAESTGRFEGVRPGKTQIRVSFNNLQAWVDVDVVANRFKFIGDPELDSSKSSGSDFVVNVPIQADVQAGNLEYRLTKVGDDVAEADASDWKQATAVADVLQVKLDSPKLRLNKLNRYLLIVESREIGDNENLTLERCPFTFSLGATGAERDAE